MGIQDLRSRASDATSLVLHRLDLHSQISFLAVIAAEQPLNIPSPFFTLTMCIHWCCKNCLDKLTKLTHHWAYERCNDFFIARSRDEYLTDCPNGPWQERRAFHRHPYRGPQMCDSCRMAGRKEKKLLQSARQKANVALGHLPEYTGTIDLGELEIPETFQKDPQLQSELGEVNAMKDKWESFGAANTHLPSPGLDRQWASTFATCNDVGPKGGVWQQPSQIASTNGRWMSEENDNRVDTALAREFSRDTHLQIQHEPISNTLKRNGTLPQGACPFIQYIPNSTTKVPNSTIAERETSLITNQHIQHKHDISQDRETDTGTDEREAIPVEEAQSRTPNHHHPQLPSHIYSGMPNKSDLFAIAEEQDFPRNPDRCKFSDPSRTTTRASSSQSIRTRPWDL